MNEFEEHINKKVDERFARIEEKLRNSFQEIKKDITALKNKESPKEKTQTSIIPQKDYSNEIAKLSQDISSLNQNILKKEDLESLKQSLSQEITDELKKTDKKLSELRKDFSATKLETYDQFESQKRDIRNLKKNFKNLD
jgi:DNA repair exonuclease SbcCD ATPase subunit